MALVMGSAEAWTWGSGNFQWLQSCSGHGTPHFAEKRCICDDGFGSESDISIAKSPRCDVRICPAGKSWFDLAKSTTEAHGLAECSDAGTCDRATGLCRCFEGKAGPACDQLACPQNCGGHGKCLKMEDLAGDSEAFPLSTSVATTYGSFSTKGTTTWDQDIVYGCVCDSSWPVGLGSGETQLAEWFGSGCSLRRCPSGDDPLTSVDDTDCNGTSSNGASTSAPVGSSGNKCHVECSNRGLCDHESGVCNCFAGFYGSACNIQDALAASSE